MKFSAKFGAAGLLASVASAAPVAQRAALTDADILQFALTLEHLENVFYKQAISTIPYESFIASGYSDAFYQNLLYVAHDEETHVVALTAALKAAGATPVAACEYSFPFTDAYSFAATASILEGVGVAAYTGAAPAVSNPEYLAVAAAILDTEAIHQSLLRFNTGAISPADPFGTALGANEVYTMASAFITSCPASNPTLPFTAFPALTPTATGIVYQGQPLTFTTTATIPSGAFLTFVSGLNTISVPAAVSGTALTAAVPALTEGQAYALVTSVNTTAIEDSQVVAGPVAMQVVSLPPTIDFSVL